MISLQNLDREHAFNDADERLVMTIVSGSMGVALENARLFEQTNILLAADGRGAELSVISSVQQGLAAKLEMQAMYDLVGDRLRDVFDAQVVDIEIFDARRSCSISP